MMAEERILVQDALNEASALVQDLEAMQQRLARITEHLARAREERNDQ